MLRAWRHWGSCREPEAPWPWLRQITRREAFRALGRPSALGIDDVAELPQPQAERSMEEAVHQRLEVERALRGLSARDRALVLLKYNLDLSYVTIANLLELPASTVRVRAHRILRTIRMNSGDQHLAQDHDIGTHASSG